jgi:hypothetical protein
VRPRNAPIGGVLSNQRVVLDQQHASEQLRKGLPEVAEVAEVAEVDAAGGEDEAEEEGGEDEAEEGGEDEEAQEVRGDFIRMLRRHQLPW